MPKFKGKKKPKASKPIFWVRSPSGIEHRVDPTDGRQTACGITINTVTWSMPREETLDRVLSDESVRLCRLPECRGVLYA